MESRMPGISTDIVDAYVYRTQNGRTEFLLIRRAGEGPLAGTWHGNHGRCGSGETAISAARRIVKSQTGLDDLEAFSADYINQFFDHASDTIVLAPVFAFRATSAARVKLDSDFDDYAWCSRDEATGRLTFAGQRWAVRHIEDVIAQPGIDADIYRID
jgi:dihydroneopterin triphosphate diphosphatase